tara:strand:+ start:582 stop:761 length:180 start_codon:yes stop_codon:yes gene_type:complete
MMGKMATAWFRWVEAKLSRIEREKDNLEESLATLKRQQKRMLYLIMGVLGIYGILLFTV